MNNCDTILVLSGEATGKEINAIYKPSYILEGVSQI
ncbi:MAG: hypothetical protein ACRCW8_02375 [Cetobacterium sp.]